MSNNKIIRIWGGLGNQLFQYSYGKFLEKKLEKEILFNIEWFNQSNKRRFILKDILKFTNETSEKKISLIQKVANYRMENTYKYLSKKNFYLLPETLIGYWQDIFFARYLKIDNFKDNFFSQSIKNLEKDYYVLHFRGGDFYKSKDHVVLDTNYYEKSSSYFNDKVIYCISDDQIKLDTLLIDLNLSNTIKLDLNELDAFRLIYNSKGGIASNSTFCWWPVFLSNNKNWVFSKIWLKNKSLFDENLYIKNTLVL